MKLPAFHGSDDTPLGGGATLDERPYHFVAVKRDKNYAEEHTPAMRGQSVSYSMRDNFDGTYVCRRHN